ncbi:MAG: hypothetical protein Q4D26_08365 [Clostridia bacterium]|nr:hypothetical protein [Clostridia bacterium]
MINFFYRLRFRVGCGKICSLWNHIIRHLFGLIFPVYCSLTKPKYGLNREKRNEEIIISLTSFPARLNVVHLCIRGLLMQSLKPDRIMLWLTEEECKNIKLPKKIEELKKYGLEICYAKENLRPHNKLYYTMKENPDAVIITVDDDIVYDTRLVEVLYNAYKENPDCVCCNLAHEITLKNGLPDEYDNWRGGAIGKSGKSDLFVALGFCGVLYPPNCFDNEYFDYKLIKDLALSADDLWLKATELRLNIPVNKVNENTKYPFSVRQSQKSALGKENNGMKRNDIIMKKLCNYYKFDWTNLK